MGIEGNFRHISSALLDVVQLDLEVLSTYLYSCECIENEGLPELRTYLCDKGFSESINRILDEDLWRLGRLDIDSDWHAMHYLLTGDATCWEECNLPFIVTRQEHSNCLLVNAVMGGKGIQGTAAGSLSFTDFGPIRYLTQDETRHVAEALLQISEEEFEQRCEDAERASPKIYRSFRDGESEHYWYTFQCIREYYKLAAEKERAMLLYLGCFHGVDFEWEDPCVTG